MNSTTAMHPAGRKEEKILASGEKRWSDHGRWAQCMTGAALQSGQHATADEASCAWGESLAFFQLAVMNSQSVHIKNPISTYITLTNTQWICRI